MKSLGIALVLLAGLSAQAQTQREVQVVHCGEYKETALISNPYDQKRSFAQYSFKVQYKDGQSGSRIGIGTVTDSEGNAIVINYGVRSGNSNFPEGYNFRIWSKGGPSTSRELLTDITLDEPVGMSLRYTANITPTVRTSIYLRCFPQ